MSVLTLQATGNLGEEITVMLYSGMLLQWHDHMLLVQ